MDLSLEYRLMCLNAEEIQDKWQPQIGDYMLVKAGYCYDNDNIKCNNKNPCPSCLEMDNVFVISGEFEFAKEIGGKHWFYGGGNCARNGNRLADDTFCFVMTETGYSEISNECYRSSKKEMLWLPKQDQIQDMFLEGCTNIHKLELLMDFLNTKAEYNAHTYSMEMYWLMFYMYEKHNKKWNVTSNIKKWENTKS